MEQFLNSLADYSNLVLLILNSLLVIITGVYAYLTWKMAREMKIARESQLDSNVIVVPVDAGRIYVRIQLENMGPGIALEIELSISLDPPHQKTTKIWKHPALLVGQKELFLFPCNGNSGGEPESLAQLAEKQNKLVLMLKWRNIFGHAKSFLATYKLSELAQDWYKEGHIIKPEDLPHQMQKVTKSLDETQDCIEEISRSLNQSDHIDYTNTLKRNSSTKSKVSRKKKVIK